MDFLAHLYIDSSGQEHRQSVSDHCHEAASFAAHDLEAVGIPNAGYLCGLLHDAGKFQEGYQQYLRDAVQGIPVKRGAVIHTFQGCRFLLDSFHGDTPATYQDVTSEILAYAVGSHHGLFDCVDTKKRSGFMHRITEDITSYQETISAYFELCADQETIRSYFSQACSEMEVIYQKFELLTKDTPDEKYGEEMAFYLGLLTRLLLSATIDGDRQSTADFMNGQSSTLPEADETLWQTCLEHCEKELSHFPNLSAIENARHEISFLCAAAGKMGPGVFRLNIPTGSGKTLSSLRFALHHAVKWNKKRIIFVSPLLSILEQNAKVIRDFLGNNAIILEHHSNVIQTDETAEDLDRSELLSENWNCPVIITTMVQFLNTLFDGKTTCIRRLQALADSIIVIDEVQSIPNHMLSIFNLSVNFLSEVCGATIVFCSATQPCFEKADHPISVQVQDIIPYDAKLWKPFQRTILQDDGEMSIESIAEFALQKLSEKNSLLIVCNKKAEAESLFQLLSESVDRCFHLSSSMCVQHRRDTLSEIISALAASRTDGNQKVICVSTQVIEAGVDISFEYVIRLRAGLDNIIQAAGRCNRNGESPDQATVSVIGCENERLGALRDIQRSKDAMTELLYAFGKEPTRFFNDLASDASVTYFYKALYRQMPVRYQDFTVENTSIFSLLSDNERYADTTCEGAGRYCLNQAFQTSGALFTVFDDSSYDVVVPYGEGCKLIVELCSGNNACDPVFMADWLKRIRPFIISIYDYQRKKIGNGGLSKIGNILILQPDHYDLKTGFREEGNKFDLWEV